MRSIFVCTMDIQSEKQTVEKLLLRLADALNSGDISSIPSFYTEDGIFMPDGFKVLTQDKLSKSGNSYLKRTRFKITFFIQDIIVNEGYAFVDATAETQTIDPVKNKLVLTTSRDFFVLRRINGEWKIYRYMFNHVKAR
jgi:ketosteroid isomerase-like protein